MRENPKDTHEMMQKKETLEPNVQRNIDQIEMNINRNNGGKLAAPMIPVDQIKQPAVIHEGNVSTNGEYDDQDISSSDDTQDITNRT